jgi:hypothetical protein
MKKTITQDKLIVMDKARAKKIPKNARQVNFVRELAQYLVGDQVHKSIQLSMGLLPAREWAKLRNATTLFGYPTVEEAERELTTFLKGL